MVESSNFTLDAGCVGGAQGSFIISPPSQGDNVKKAQRDYWEGIKKTLKYPHCNNRGFEKVYEPGRKFFMEQKFCLKLFLLIRTI